VPKARLQAPVLAVFEFKVLDDPAGNDGVDTCTDVEAGEFSRASSGFRTSCSSSGSIRGAATPERSKPVIPSGWTVRQRNRPREEPFRGFFVATVIVPSTETTKSLERLVLMALPRSSYGFKSGQRGHIFMKYVFLRSRLRLPIRKIDRKASWTLGGTDHPSFLCRDDEKLKSKLAGRQRDAYADGFPTKRQTT
jgi:hypothetical protein